MKGDTGKYRSSLALDLFRKRKLALLQQKLNLTRLAPTFSNKYVEPETDKPDFI